MVLKNYRTIVSTQTYSGSATTTVTDLPRDFLIQRIVLDFYGTTTISSTSTLVQQSELKQLVRVAQEQFLKLPVMIFTILTFLIMDFQPH